MKTITVRDLRRRGWSEIEATLRGVEEILITRDSKPVAKLVRVLEQVPKRKRWNPEEHKKWIKKVWGNKQVHLVDKYLRADPAVTMKTKAQKPVPGSFAASVESALKRAAKVARKTARMHGTRLYFWKNGKVVSVKP